jgi:hypothetical protein
MKVGKVHLQFHENLVFNKRTGERREIMKSAIITKKRKGEIYEMENLLYYWYILGLCVCDIRYDEWWERDKPNICKN